MKINQIFRFAPVLFFSALSIGSFARAAEVNITTASRLTNQAAEDLLKTVAFGADHRAYQSASPLGLLIGFDVGVDVTAISPPQSFRDALALAGNTEKVPALLPIPRFNLRKGLPWGVDVGASFITFKGNHLIGGDVQWSALDEKSPVSMSGRLGYNHNKLWYLSSSTWSFDIVASLNGLLVVEPYAGLGLQTASGELSIPASAGTLPVNVSSSQSFTSPRIFVGLPLKLSLLHLTFEYGHSFAGINIYGAKVSLSL